jgi:acyl-CoA reductase-like NAD-dependent aldehyde dehydrogenase
MAGLPVSSVILVEEPATGAVLGEVPNHGAEAVRAAVGRAREAQRAWGASSPRERAKVLKQARAAFSDHKDELATLLARENGKPVSEALLMEVAPLLLCLTWLVSRGPGILAPRPMKGLFPLVRHTHTHRAPHGVAAIISPWNFPLLLPFSGIAEALMAGNAVVLKPSEHTPLIALKAAEILREAGLPAGLLEVVTGDGATGAALLEAGVDKVCFTGSVAAGRRVGARCGELLIPCTLELGGKAPAIVLEHADLTRTANAIAFGSFANAGQICMAIERVYAPASLHDELVERVATLTRGLRIGDPLSPDTDIGALTMPGQREHVDALVQDAVAAGARLVTGGRAREGAGRFYEPAVLVDVTDDMRIAREEIFGPALPFLRYADPEDAIRRANDSHLGLMGYVFGEEKRHTREVARRICAGQVLINDVLTSYSMPELPFGGVKASGYGRVHGEEGLLAMCQTRVVCDDRITFAPGRDPWWFPYSGKAVKTVLGTVRKTLAVLDVTSRR